jgi:hypothetical protein
VVFGTWQRSFSSCGPASCSWAHVPLRKHPLDLVGVVPLVQAWQAVSPIELWLSDPILRCTLALFGYGEPSTCLRATETKSTSGVCLKARAELFSLVVR